MNQWAFVIAAYAVAIVAVAGLCLYSFAAMRRIERQDAQLRAGKRDEA